MFFRLTILGVILICGCRSGLIDCPEVKGIRARQTVIHTKNLKPEDLYVSSLTSKERQQARSMAKLKEQKHDVKDPASMEEWDCPRPGEQKNNKIVKGNIRRMEKKMYAEMKKRNIDSLSNLVSPQFTDKP